jgi:hypothetical protein
MEKSEFAVIVVGFENLWFELDNCGRTTKTPIVASIVYGWKGAEAANPRAIHNFQNPGKHNVFWRLIVLADAFLLR